MGTEGFMAYWKNPAVYLGAISVLVGTGNMGALAAADFSPGDAGFVVLESLQEKQENGTTQEKEVAKKQDTSETQDPKDDSQKTAQQLDENAGIPTEGDPPPADPSAPRDNTPTPIDWSVEGTMDLNFDHLKFDIQPDEAFQIRQLTADLIKLRGHKIRIRGYIKPAFKSKDIKKFVMVRDNQECCFGPGAALYDCMIVEMKEGATTDYSTRPITIEGTFQLKPYRGADKKIWAIFSMKDATVE